jgi:hypothetical protein
MVDLNRRSFLRRGTKISAATAAMLALPVAAQAAAPSQAGELDALFARWAAVYPRLDAEGQELVRGALQAHVVLFERIAG